MAAKKLNPLQIVIDSTSYVVHDNDQEGASLLRLASRDPGIFDLFLVDEAGVEHLVRDDQIVKVSTGAEFVSRRKVRFTIDGEQHASYDDDQSAAALLRMAGLNPAEYDLALVPTTGAPQSFKDDELVRIANGDEFVTNRRVGGVA